MATQKGSNESIELNTKLDGVLNEFKLSVENYPNLKANETEKQIDLETRFVISKGPKPVINNEVFEKVLEMFKILKNYTYS